MTAATTTHTQRIPTYCYQCVAGPDLLTVKVVDGVATEVVVVEPTGADTQVFTKIAGVEVTSVFRERHDFKPGAMIRLKPDVTRAHLFDAASGVRLAA